MGVHEASVTLPAELSSAGRARRFLREALASWGTDRYDVAGPQVVTELATNAALHARSDFTIRVRLEPDALLVEVTDTSPARPTRRHYGTDATTGRGMAMVDALSTVWGVEVAGPGKTVWCRVAPDDVSLGVEDLGSRHGQPPDAAAPPALWSGARSGATTALAA